MPRFAQQTGQQIGYERLLAPLDALRSKPWHAFIDAGGRGANVTVPFKLEAHAAGDRADGARAGGRRRQYAAL